MTVSVCTIVRGRRAQLSNLVRGLERQMRQPDELVVAYMQDRAYDLPRTSFPVRTVFVAGEPMPLARARNQAASAAAGSVLVFLDVDCIPGPDLVGAYTEAIARERECVMGPTRYLGPSDTNVAATFENLWDQAVRHPARLDPLDAPSTVAIDDFGELWGLSFALPRDVFVRIGGFDERFVGYGGEESDFARSLEEAGMGLRWIAAARAVHQWHPVARPPLIHFEDIVRNAKLYRDKRGEWPMTYWLDQFADDGWIVRHDDTITVRRTPSASERAAAIRHDAPFS